jgi:hypothetical protein
MRAAQTIVRAAALYNLGGAATFLTPGVLPLVGLTPPAALWLWLPAIFGCFVAVVLWFSARDLETYGAFPYWNGWFRLLFVIAVFVFDLGNVGVFITYLAIGDLVLAVATIVSVRIASGKTTYQLLTNS